MARDRKGVLVTVEEAGAILGVSRSTVWRMIQRGELPTTRVGHRRLVPSVSLRVARGASKKRAAVPSLSPEHPFLKLLGSARSGGAGPGSSDKHAYLDE